MATGVVLGIVVTTTLVVAIDEFKKVRRRKAYEKTLPPYERGCLL